MNICNSDKLLIAMARPPPPVQQQAFRLEMLQFGIVSLQVFPNSNISFKILPDLQISKEQKCLLDNLWIASKK